MRRVPLTAVSLVILISLFLLASCGGSGGAGSRAVDAVAEGYLGGTWSGTYTSRLGQGGGSLTITISQNAMGDFAGTASITGHITDNRGVVAGSVSNPSGPGDLTFAISWSSGDVSTFIGTYNSSAISGGYTDTMSDAGRFALSK